MVMTVLMNQVVHEIQVVAVEAVDEREAGPVAVTEADHTGRAKRHHAGSEQLQQVMPLGPRSSEGLPSPADAGDLLRAGDRKRFRLAVAPVAQGGADGRWSGRRCGCVNGFPPRPVPLHESS